MGWLAVTTRIQDDMVAAGTSALLKKTGTMMIAPMAAGQVSDDVAGDDGGLGEVDVAAWGTCPDGAVEQEFHEHDDQDGLQREVG